MPKLASLLFLTLERVVGYTVTTTKEAAWVNLTVFLIPLGWYIILIIQKTTHASFMISVIATILVLINVLLPSKTLQRLKRVVLHLEMD